MSAEIVHIVMWKLKRPGLLTSTSTEDALAQAKKSIAKLKSVPGPEIVGQILNVSHDLIILGQLHLGPPMITDRAKGFDWGKMRLDVWLGTY
jgi:hypothetical protein